VDIAGDWELIALSSILNAKSESPHAYGSILICR
jgi:hypothetical protein